MPLRNLAGWFGTGLLFIAVGRLAWSERRAPSVPVALPYADYALNIVWSMILSVAAGMWPTAITAILVSLLPARWRSRARGARACRDIAAVKGKWAPS
jgi:uncharacterized membrane protein